MMFPGLAHRKHSINSYYKTEGRWGSTHVSLWREEWFSRGPLRGSSWDSWCPQREVSTFQTQQFHGLHWTLRVQGDWYNQSQWHAGPLPAFCPVPGGQSVVFPVNCPLRQEDITIPSYRSFRAKEMRIEKCYTLSLTKNPPSSLLP